MTSSVSASNTAGAKVLQFGECGRCLALTSVGVLHARRADLRFVCEHQSVNQGPRLQDKSAYTNSDEPSSNSQSFLSGNGDG